MTHTSAVALASHPDIRLLFNRIYEYQKGIRHLFLSTIEIDLVEYVCYKLDQEGIPYLLQPIPRQKERYNLFFGRRECIDAVRVLVVDRSLSTLSAEEDFMLGVMLGYDTCMQCHRYCKKKQLEETPLSPLLQRGVS